MITVARLVVSPGSALNNTSVRVLFVKTLLEFEPTYKFTIEGLHLSIFDCVKNYKPNSPLQPLT
jgi:hypothetical protein